jgi:hypothetical protein
MWTRQQNLLSLFEWCEVIGVNPYLLAQIGEPSNLLSNSLGQCENVFYQTAAAGSGHLSREDIATAIGQAEIAVANWCKAWPAPKAESYPVEYPRSANLRWRQLWYGTSGRLKTVVANYGFIQSMGVYVDTLIEADVALVLSDPYGDGFDTFWSISVTVPTGTTADELTVFYSAGDIPIPLSREECQIRPVTINISGTTATITGQLVQAVQLTNYLKRVGTPLDATDPTIYITTVDVYRRTIDLNQSGTLIWNEGDCPEPPCNYYSSSACFQSTNARQGYITPIPAEYDTTIENYSRLYPNRIDAPDQVNVNVISGIPLVNGQMASPFREAVAYLSVGSFLQSRSCGCEIADNIILALRSMPTTSKGTLEISQRLYDAVSSKFGVVNRGTVKAYNAVMNNPSQRVFRSGAW